MTRSAVERVAALDWAAAADALNTEGCALTGPLLSTAQCAALVALYDSPDAADAAVANGAQPRNRHFRSRVVMQRHGFGRGEYQYFAYPLPALVAALRAAFYEPLARIANHWNEALGIPQRFSGEHTEFLARCHQAGQVRPTPLLLKYAAGDYNCLHQDLYGEHVFPLQVTILLNDPGTDFTGGEFVLTEQRPRMQSRVKVVPLQRGEGVIFPVNHRPVNGTRGIYRVAMRHGVSVLRTGQRHTLGIIFHDAL